MKIAVDAVGGDHYPEYPVQGAIEALVKNPSVEILLVGPEDIVKKELEKHDYDASRVSVLHAPEIVDMDESASSALKKKPSSSISLGLKAHKENVCSAFVSAGNTGALLAVSMFTLGKLDGVIRPTIAAPYPTIKGMSLLIDAGANLELKPEMYEQFAKMAVIFCKEILGNPEPTIGLMNIGEETEKGTETHKEAFRLLSSLKGFKGNIEGKDILFGKTDIYLTDGFTGNTLLKFGESIPEVLKHILSETMKREKVPEELQKKIYELISISLSTFNYEEVGGVPFLGVNGISLVGHGGSSPLAICNMVLNAAQCVENEVNRKIVASLNQ
ncbi:MAG: phosphate acyltransferase PlsX [Balneolaceae bacterium]|nr:phosphate acyltransferase PlsX [Balneolaceae bacterium]MCH8547552.1 phosphate acyltransferase PlsX [Balneolaceae bacterium]